MHRLESFSSVNAPGHSQNEDCLERKIKTWIEYLQDTVAVIHSHTART